MRRVLTVSRAARAIAVSGWLVAGALLAAPPALAQEAAPQKPQGVTFDGNMALWTVAIKADKTADFEKILQRVQEALQKSEKPGRKEQAAGWKVMKLGKPMPDGNIPYVHIISPVVKGADYSLMTILYEVFPSESQQLYDLYRGAFAANLSLVAGDLAADLAKVP